MGRRLLGAGMFVVGCTRAPGGTPPSAAAAAGPSDPVAWRYEVRSEVGGELSVEGNFGGHNDGVFSAEDVAAPFVRDVGFAHEGSWVAALKQGESWVVPCRSGCRIRYRFQLREACLTLSQPDTALASGEVLIAPPSTWLLHPGAAAKGTQFELKVDAGPNGHFVTAFQRTPGGPPNSYRAATGVLDDAAYAAFGPLQLMELPAGDTTVQLAIAANGLGLTREQAQDWVTASAGAVASYYRGHLPARHALVLLMTGSGRETSGLTLGGGGPAVLIRASSRITAATTRDDWVVTHELLHANFPDIGRAHAWLSEGLATYLEPIARARAGQLSETKVWRDLFDGLPQGLPQALDQGLEKTRTWGRTYWGGALFCLMADLTLREETGNQRSLDDVLLAIGNTGASDEDFWPLPRVLDMAERATGTQVLRELYERLAEKPGTVDLPALFARLGVQKAGSSVIFDEAAPLAKIRRSITARSPG